MTMFGCSNNQQEEKQEYFLFDIPYYNKNVIELKASKINKEKTTTLILESVEHKNVA